MSWLSDVLAKGPDLFLRLGEASGSTMVDSSGNGHNGTYDSTVTYGVTGAISDDSDTGVDCLGGGSNGGDDRGAGTVAYGSWMNRTTLCAFIWFKVSVTTDGAIFMRWGDTAAVKSWGIDFSGGNLRGFVGVGGSSRVVTTAASAYADGKWHLAAVTYDGSTVRLVVDGISKGTPVSISGSAQTSTTEPIAIGWSAGSLSSAAAFSGQLDDGYFGPYISVADLLTLYNTARTISAAVTLAGTSTLSAAPRQDIPATVTMAGTSTLAAAPIQQISPAVTMAGSSTLAADVQLASVVVTMAGDSSLAVSPTQEIPAAPTMAGTSTLAVTARQDIAVAPTLAGTSTLAVTPTLEHPTTAALAGTGTLAIAAHLEQTATVTLTGTSSLAATGRQDIPTPVTLAGTSSLDVAVDTVAVAAIALIGQSTLAVDAYLELPSNITLAGLGSLMATAATAILASVELAGVGTLAVTAHAAPFRDITLTGRLLAARWTGQLTAPRRTGTLRPPRWTGHLETT